MRKLILLSVLILFSCSKEDSGVDSANQALIASLNAQITALNAQISAMNSEIAALQYQVAENSSLESQLNELNSQLNEVNSQLNEVNSQVNELQDALEESNSLLTEKTLDLEDAENTIIDLIDTIESLNKEFALIEKTILIWIERAAGYYEFEYYQNNVYVGTFAWEIGLTENDDIIWNTYYLSGNCYFKNINASFGDDAEFYFTEASLDDLGVGANNVDGETVGLPGFDKVILVERYTIDLSGGLEVILNVYDYNLNLIRTIVNVGSSLQKKTKSQLVYSFCSNNGISDTNNNQDTSIDTENQETSDNSGGTSTDNSNLTDNTENQETSASESNNSDSSTTENQTSVSDNPNIYLASNGVTVKATADAKVGEVGLINGIVYEVVDEDKLREMISNNQDVTKVVTSKVYNMKELFKNNYDFNQDIGSWDVSNVTDMGLMFYGTSFNQDISSWDVSNVTNMYNMFANSRFNKPIGNWDVSKVENMLAIFSRSPFNQDISSWDVSNVKEFSAAFGHSYFNQDISSWDVSSATGMQTMFFKAYFFNQDLSSWNVSNVINCLNFSEDAYSYDKPKPSFTNCNPD